MGAISGEATLEPALEAFAPHGANLRNMATGRTQIADLLLACITDFNLKISGRKVARDGFTADHADHPHAVTNIWQMRPMTESNILDSPIQPQCSADGLLVTLHTEQL